MLHAAHPEAEDIPDTAFGKASHAVINKAPKSLLYYSLFKFIWALTQMGPFSHLRAIFINYGMRMHGIIHLWHEVTNIHRGEAEVDISHRVP